MRRVMAILVLSAASSACTTEEACGEAHIEKKSICGISIGISAVELRKNHPERISETKVIREGEQPALFYSFNSRQRATLELDQYQKVWAIRVDTDAIKTRQGIGVGDSYEKVSLAYPNAKLSYGLEEGPYVSLLIEDIGGFVSFDVSGLDKNLLASASLDASKLKNLKAEMVIIH